MPPVIPFAQGKNDGPACRLTARALLFALLALLVAGPASEAPRDRGLARSAGGEPPSAPLPLQARATALPLRFEANEGEFDPSVRYVARGRGRTLFLTDEGGTLVLGEDSPATLTLRAARGRSVTPRASELLSTKTNYFIGNDRSAWRTDVPNFGRVTYAGVAPGIDLVFHGGGGEDGAGLEYDFVVGPGARVTDAVLEIEGIDGVSLDAQGDLVVRAGGRTMVQSRPNVYQRDGAGRHALAGAFRLVDPRHVGFEVAEYDHTRPLVIDPTLAYSTFLGGSGSDQAEAIAVDASGEAFVTGKTSSTNFPTHSPYQAAALGAPTVFVAKLAANGQSAVYATYVGGSGGDTGYGIAIDAQGDAFVAGQTSSSNFPTKSASSKPPYETTVENVFPGTAFVAKLGPAGNTLLYSTYIGGSGGAGASGIAVDSAGLAYVAGSAGSDFVPATGNYPVGSDSGSASIQAAFAVCVDAAGDALDYVTFLGGSNEDAASAIALDSSKAAYLTGGVTSTDFPTTDTSTMANGADQNVFVARLAPTTGAVTYASVLGGSYEDSAEGIAVDGSGRAYVAGFTSSTSFPTTPSTAFQKTFTSGAKSNAFLFITTTPATATTPNHITYGTFLGGSINDLGHAIALSGGNVYVAGYTDSTNFPLVPSTQTRDTGAFVTVFSASALLGTAVTSPTYSTVFGGSTYDAAYGIGVDSSGGIGVAGIAQSPDFPTVNPIQASLDGVADAFVAALRPFPTLSPLTASVPPLGSQQFTLTGTGSVTWSISPNNSGGSVGATGAYTAGPKPNVVDTVVITDSYGDTRSATVDVGDGVSILAGATFTTTGGTLSFKAAGGSGTGYVWSLTGSSGGSIGATTGVYVAGSHGSTTDTVTVTDSLGNTASVTISVGPSLAIIPSATSTPPNGSLTFTATGGSGSGYVWSINPNGSGGSISAAGDYTAGPTGNTTDTIVVTDSLSEHAAVNIAVGGGIAITPASPTTPPRGSIAFGATGGTGAGYVWSLTGASGGAIVPSTGAYTAGPNANTTDVVMVTDSSGTNTASVSVTIGAGISVTPASTTVAAGGTATFSATGGYGSSYLWSVALDRSGGSITSTGVYTAGSLGGVTDTIQVTDVLGNVQTAAAIVAAGPVPDAGGGEDASLPPGEDGGPMAAPDSGPGQAPDSGGTVVTAGSDDAGAQGESSPSSGCGCRMGGARAEGPFGGWSFAWVGGIVALLLVARRRARARRLARQVLGAAALFTAAGCSNSGSPEVSADSGVADATIAFDSSPATTPDSSPAAEASPPSDGASEDAPVDAPPDTSVDLCNGRLLGALNLPVTAIPGPAPGSGHLATPPSCNSSATGPEDVYSLHFASAVGLFAQATASGGQPTVRVLGSCSGPDVACATGTGAAALRTSLDAGDYVLAVGQALGTSGTPVAYELQASDFTVAPNAECSAAVPLVPTDGGPTTGSTTGSLPFVTADGGTGQCSPAAGAGFVYYAVTVPPATEWTVTVQPTGDWAASVDQLDSCAAASCQVTSGAAAQPVAVTIGSGSPDAGATNAILAVSSVDPGVTGAFTISVTSVALPSCAGADGTACDSTSHCCSHACFSNADPTHCGSSCSACASPPPDAGETETCQAQSDAGLGAYACTVGCAAGYGLCNGSCLELNTPAHCGSCSSACTTSDPNATVQCLSGACPPPECKPGWSYCNGSALCDQLGTVATCSGCNDDCDRFVGKNNVTAVSCAPTPAPGSCVVASCATGFADCNGLIADGCEKSLTSPTTCGTCGNDCTASLGPAASCGGGGTCECVPSSTVCAPDLSTLEEGCDPNPSGCFFANDGPAGWSLSASVDGTTCGCCGDSCCTNWRNGAFVQGGDCCIPWPNAEGYCCRGGTPDCE